MQMKAAHLVSVLIVAAILLSALPLPSAIREPRDPAATRTTTATSSVHTTVTTAKIATTNRHSSSVPTTTQPSVPTTMEFSVPVCVVAVGLVQQDGSTEWIGTGVTGAPISECQNTAEYFNDAAGGTVAINQFIVNGTSSEMVP